MAEIALSLDGFGATQEYTFARLGGKGILNLITA